MRTDFEIGDKVEISMTGRVVAIQEDVFDFGKEGGARIVYVVSSDEMNCRVTVPEEAIVQSLKR